MVVLKHVRDVNNYIRTAISRGADIASPEGRDQVIRGFLKDCAPEGGATTPEIFLFFLQKLNAHALYEDFDNAAYTITFPSYIPFDVVEVAAKYGYPDIIRTVENNLYHRSQRIGVTKTASAAFRDLGGSDYMDKVASFNSSATDKRMFDEIRDKLAFDKQAEIRDLRTEVGRMFWTYKNLEDYTKLESFKCNPHYVELFNDIKSHTPILGGRDKTASLSDYNQLVGLLDSILAKSK